MKLDKSKRTVIAMLCLYLAIGIIAVVLFAFFGSKTSRKSATIEYTFEDDGKAGNSVELTSIKAIGESGEPTPAVTPEVTSEEEPETTPEVEKAYYRFKVGTVVDHLRVRKDPGLDGKILNFFDKGEEGYILQMGEEWSLVSDGERIGYCSNEYLILTEISIDDLPDYFPDEFK